jgi:hypothetical protein
MKRVVAVPTALHFVLGLRSPIVLPTSDESMRDDWSAVAEDLRLAMQLVVAEDHQRRELAGQTRKAR